MKLKNKPGELRVYETFLTEEIINLLKICHEVMSYD